VLRNTETIDLDLDVELFRVQRSRLAPPQTAHINGIFSQLFGSAVGNNVKAVIVGPN
jgi:hypothetical protein